MAEEDDVKPQFLTISVKVPNGDPIQLKVKKVMISVRIVLFFPQNINL